MSIRTRFDALVHWVFGSLPEAVRHPRSGALITLVASVGALSILADLRYPVKKAPVFDDIWTLAVFGALPFAVAVAWELGRKRSAWVGWTVGVLVVATPLVLRLGVDGWDGSMRDDPLLMLAPLVIGTVIVAGAGMHAEVDFEGFGVSWGDWRWWLPRTLVLTVGMVLMVVVAAWIFPDLRDAYPRNKAAQSAFSELMRYQLAMGWYMLGWEFFFRGFLLFLMARRGDWLFAVLFQAMPFFILHQHKPEVEMVASFIGAIGAGYFCLRARSFIPLFLLHWGMNCSMDIVGFIWRNFVNV